MGKADLGAGQRECKRRYLPGDRKGMVKRGESSAAQQQKAQQQKQQRREVFPAGERLRFRFNMLFVQAFSLLSG